jgi:hypothetical protein
MVACENIRQLDAEQATKNYTGKVLTSCIVIGSTHSAVVSYGGTSDEVKTGQMYNTVKRKISLSADTVRLG